MPSRDALFEADTEEKFLTLRYSESQHQAQNPSLKEWVSRYICSEWESSLDWAAVLEPKDLLMHVIGMLFRYLPCPRLTCATC